MAKSFVLSQNVLAPKLDLAMLLENLIASAHDHALHARHVTFPGSDLKVLVDDPAVVSQGLIVNV